MRAGLGPHLLGMHPPIFVRELSGAERARLEASLRAASAFTVRRAQIVVHALEGLNAPEISARTGWCGATVRHWLKRFHARGLQGLEEDVRSGRPPPYSAAQRSAVIDTALTRPADLGLPFASWTLDRPCAVLLTAPASQTDFPSADGKWSPT